jgi:TRAP-type C4-dicarboxylate transport system substrate-binding protein
LSLSFTAGSILHHVTRAIAAALCLALCSTPAVAEPVTFRMATLAPEGSSWMREFKKWARTLERRSKGRIRLKFYPGAVMGDEREMVHKLRSGTLDAAALTQIGLSIVTPDILLFEVPFFITRVDELDYVRGKLDGDLRKMFEENGFQLLAWGDVGPIHLFTNIPIASHADLKKVNM